MAITQTEINRHVEAGNNHIDYSVTFDTAYAAGGEALTFGSATNFQNAVEQIVVTKHPTGWFVNPVVGASLTSHKLILEGSASTTSGRSEVAFLVPTTGFDASSLKCQIRVFGR